MTDILLTVCYIIMSEFAPLKVWTFFGGVLRELYLDQYIQATASWIRSFFQQLTNSDPYYKQVPSEPQTPTDVDYFWDQKSYQFIHVQILNQGGITILVTSFININTRTILLA